MNRGSEDILAAVDDSDLSKTPGSDLADSSSPGVADANDWKAPYPGQVVDGKYQLGALLGRGGMGWVFEATHLQTEKRVALKYLDPNLRASKHWVRRFEREARAAGRLDHPNIIRIYDVGGEGPSLYLVMERVRGETLRTRLARGPIPAAEALTIMLGVARGVSEAHRHGIVHRDLKPENIMLSVLSDGSADQPKVLDFGVSKIVQQPSAESGLSVSETAVAGTPRYMPLEQLRGEPCDARADVYALGVVFYEMLTGKRPFEARTRADLAIRLATERPARLVLDDAPLAARVQAVLERALARLPDQRFQTVDELAQGLRGAFGGRSDAGRQPALDRTATMPPMPRLTRALSLTAALLLLGALGVAGFALWPAPATRPTGRPTARQIRQSGQTSPHARAPLIAASTIASSASSGDLPDATPSSVPATQGPTLDATSTQAAPSTRKPRVRGNHPRSGRDHTLRDAGPRELLLLRKDF